MTVVETLTRALDQVPGVRLAVLFGSAAKGPLSSSSDIDIAVSLRPGADSSATLRVVLERAVDRSVDLIWLDEAPPLLRFEIAREGRVLVEGDPYGWADFRARAMIDWWDWAPTARMMHEVMTVRLAQEAGRGSS